MSDVDDDVMKDDVAVDEARLTGNSSDSSVTSSPDVDGVDKQDALAATVAAAAAAAAAADDVDCCDADSDRSSPLPSQSKCGQSTADFRPVSAVDSCELLHDVTKEEEGIRRGSGGPFSIHCVVERVRDVDSKQSTTGNSWQVDVDTNVDVPPSLSFHDLPYFVLKHLGYTDTETIGCKASVELKNWKPIPLDAVTEDNVVSVDHVLGDLVSLVVFRIKLNRISPCYMLGDIREKLFVFLMHNANDLLANSGCPIEQSHISQLTTNSTEQHSKLDDMKESFDKWYNEQMIRCNGRPAENSSDKPAIMPLSKIASPRISSISNGQKSSYGRTWFDPVTEIPLLQHWFHENRHPTRADMIDYSCKLNAGPNRRPPQRPIDLSNIAYWFKNARVRSAVSNSSSKDDSLATDSRQTNNIEQTICVRRSPIETSSSSEFSDGEAIPELPNRNAVYVVKPLVDTADCIEVVEENGDNMSGIVGLHCEPDQRSATPNTAVDTRKRHRSWKSDENHNCRRCSSSSSSVTDEDMATDLSVRPVEGISVTQTERTRPASIASFDSAALRLNPSFPLSERHVKQENGASTVSESRFPLHPLMAPAASTHYSFPPHLQHLQMQMAMMTQAAMRYMQPIYSAGVPGTPPSVPTMRTPTFPLLPPSLPKPSPCDDDSAGSTNGDTSSSADGRRKRSRVFIDPLSEIPRLEQWFRQDSHPSSSVIDRLTDELNRSVYRQRFPKLEPKNVQLWFKNHRAKVKRQSIECSPTSSIAGAGSLSANPFATGFREEKVSLDSSSNGDERRFSLLPGLSSSPAITNHSA